MKTTNYNENCRYGQNIEVSISSWENDPSIHVSATERNGERTTSVNLEYKAADGARVTQVQDYSEPFDTAFYSALDAKMLKVAEVISNGEEEEA